MKKNLILIAITFLLFGLTLNIALHSVSGQEQGTNKTDKVYKDGVDTSKFVKGKFRQPTPPAILVPGEYMVFFTSDVDESEVEALAKELVTPYGGEIPNETFIWRDKPRGFAVRNLLEYAARAVSEHPKVDHVTQNAVIGESGKPVDLHNLSKPLDRPTVKEMPKVEEPKTPTKKPDSDYATSLSPDDSQFNVEYNLDRIDSRNLSFNLTYNYYYNGTGVDVYVVDTGVKSTHVEFAGLSQVAISYIMGDVNACAGHATAVAGVLAGQYYGAAKNIRLISVRVADCTGGNGDNYTINAVTLARALRDIRDRVRQARLAANAPPVPSVVNISLAALDPTGTLSDVDAAVRELVNERIVVVVCAGQKSNNTIAGDQASWSPGRVNETITVGMTDNVDRKVSQKIYPQGFPSPYLFGVTEYIDTAFGSLVDLYAPAGPVGQFVTQPNGTTTFQVTRYQSVPDGRPAAANNATTPSYGTSLAAPLVSGVAAQYLQTNRYSTPAQVANALVTSFATNGVLVASSFIVGANENNRLLYEFFSSAATRNAASAAEGCSPDSLVSAYGVYSSLPNRVTIEGAGGAQVQVTTTAITTSQVNFHIPASIPASTVQIVRVFNGTTLLGHGTAVVNRLGAGIFTANSAGTGLAAGQLLRVNKSDPTQQTYDALVQSGNTWNPTTEDAYLVLYGTGMRQVTSATSRVGSTSVPVPFVGMVSGFLGLDQVNIGPLPVGLKGTGELNVELTGLFGNCCEWPQNIVVTNPTS